jgi:serine/threonine protein kinase
MEYCSGGSLAQKLARQGPLPVTEVISIGARLCSALSAVHQAGILHRDVKPHNVLLTSYGEPALADFGIASVALEDDDGHRDCGVHGRARRARGP